jgi:hypothetical protein
MRVFRQFEALNSLASEWRVFRLEPFVQFRFKTACV